jgi:hypothetical protein
LIRKILHSDNLNPNKNIPYQRMIMMFPKLRSVRQDKTLSKTPLASSRKSKESEIKEIRPIIFFRDRQDSPPKSKMMLRFCSVTG